MIYLNASAGTKPYPEVVEIITSVLRDHWGNPHDNTSFGHDARIIIDSITQQVADDINCNSDEIAWCSGACEANSLAIMGLLNKEPYTNFYTTFLEHTSIDEIAKDLPAHKVGYISNDNSGSINLDNLENALIWNHRHNMKTLVSISFANSEITLIF